MGAVFVCGSFAADGVGAHFCRAACGRRRSLLGRAWLLAGQKPGSGATRREGQHGAPVEGLQERGSRRSGECGAKGGQRHLGDRGACRGVPALPVADAAASIRLWGSFRQDFRGYGRQNPKRAREFFWKFSERVRPPSKVKSGPASEKLAGGAPFQARQTQGARPPTLSGVNWLMTHDPSQTYNPIEN